MIASDEYAIMPPSTPPGGQGTLVSCSLERDGLKWPLSTVLLTVSLLVPNTETRAETPGLRAPFEMIFAPATAPNAPPFRPVPISLPVNAWQAADVATVVSALPQPADNANRTIIVRLIEPTGPIEAVPAPAEPGSASAAPDPSPSPMELAGRLFTWLGGLFAPDFDPAGEVADRTQAPVPSAVAAPEPQTTTAAPAEKDARGWNAVSVRTAGSAGGRPDENDIPNDIRFDLVGWLSAKPADAPESVPETHQMAESGASTATENRPPAETAAPLPVPSASDPGIVIARMSDDPLGGASAGLADDAPSAPETAARPSTPQPDVAPEVALSPAGKLAAVEPAIEANDGDEPLVIYIRGTVPFRDMYFGENDHLGRKLAHAEPAVACAEKNGGGTHVCPEATAWPAELVTLFGVAAGEFPESIVRYDDRAASQYRAAFPAGNYERLVDGIRQRLGEPTKITEILSPVLGMGRQTNRIARWVSSEETALGKAILEVRSIDDVLWNLPPDLAHGVIRLYFEGAQPIYATVSRADMRLVRIRNMVAPSEEPL
ncbi:MAG: hypothetical protein RIC16_17395 [Rhodospirillales bacterium]